MCPAPCARRAWAWTRSVCFCGAAHALRAKGKEGLCCTTHRAGKKVVEILRDLMWRKDYFNLRQREQLLCLMKFTLDKRALLSMLNARNKLTHYSFTPEWFRSFLEAQTTFLGKNGNPPQLQLSQHTSDYYMMCALRDWIGGGNISIRAPLGKSRTVSLYLTCPPAGSYITFPAFTSCLDSQNN